MMDGRHIGILLCNYPHVILHLPKKFRSNRRSSDVISISQDGGHRVGKLLPSSGLVTTFVQNGENLFAYQLSITYLKPLLR